MTGRWPGHVAAGLAVCALAACADATGGSSPKGSGTAVAACSRGPLPRGLACVQLDSRAATSARGDDLGWLAAAGLTIELEHEDGETRMVVDLPCNTLAVPVRVTGSRIVPDTSRMTMTLVGCLDPVAAAHESWGLQFVSDPMDYRFRDGTLTLRTAVAEVELAPRE